MTLTPQPPYRDEELMQYTQSGASSICSDAWYFVGKLDMPSSPITY
jgi:hypothetical protein